MRSARLRRGGITALVFASVVGTTALVAAPSYATGVTIPPSETLYSLSCQEGSNNAQLAKVDSGSGVSTLVGSGNISAANCVWDAAWDAATKTAYFQVGNRHNAVYSISPSTGNSELAFTPTYNGKSIANEEFRAFAISPQGVAYGLVWVKSLDDEQLVTMDLTSGDVSLIGAIDPTNSLPGQPEDIYSLAFDPINSQLYGMSRLSGTIYQFDLTAGAATVVGSVDISSNTTDAGAYGLQFDSTGRLWFVNVTDNIQSDLSSITLPADLTPVEPVDSGPLQVNGSNFYSYALMITPAATTPPVVHPAAPKPTLATTGVNPLPGELAAMLLVALGGGLWAAGAVGRTRRL